MATKAACMHDDNAEFNRGVCDSCYRVLGTTIRRGIFTDEELVRLNKWRPKKPSGRPRKPNRKSPA